jgi:hypothetical protein
MNKLLLNIQKQTFLFLTAMSFTFPLWGATPESQSIDEGISIQLTDMPSDAIQIEAFLTTDAPAKTVWETLVDYQNLPKFVVSIKSSKLTQENNPNDKMLELHGEGDMIYIIPIKITLLLSLHETPEKYRIDFDEKAKIDFNSFRGYWSVETKPDGKTSVHLSLLTSPRHSYFGFTKKIIFSSIKWMFEDIKRESSRRNSVK